ncbi:GNAT family N-acetyltransferase [Pseudalkalibacillus sp. SCS-8]|uniref:GNAT family N-acetyltransferase n=1 Tax=Pseudalkalibacillus nanhaiensis TaxID=3115291 RepID=UPI0032DAFC2D
MNTTNQSELQHVQLFESDIPGLIALSESVGWDYAEEEIRTVLYSGQIFGHKNEEGAIVSSAAILPYEGQLASIGMVIVHESYRGLGLGRKATEACMQSLPEGTTSMLIATHEGIPLYRKMGFKEVDHVHKFICNRFVSKPLDLEGFQIRAFRDEDINQIILLDVHAFGHSRETFLKRRIQQSKDCLVVIDREESVIGFGLSIPGPVNLILGPIVAPDSHLAACLIHQLAANHDGKLRIDVPSGQEPFMNTIWKWGFEEVKQPPVMIHNGDLMPPRNGTLFGIAAQIFG